MSSDAPEGRPRLTRREREIVRALLDSCTNRDMSERFGITEQTVKNQLSALYDKLGVSSRLELVNLVQTSDLDLDAL